MQKILVTGGAGYVGSVLVPHLLREGYAVTVLDRFWYGEDVFGGARPTLVKGDIRDEKTVREAMRGVDAVIHLACISNDPSFELDADLGRSINLDAFPAIVRAACAQGVQRFVYASSSSVYGVRSEPDVVEDTPCTPLTDYSRFKLDCERMLHEEWSGDGAYVIVRPATVCGYGPRMRLDLTVNILTIHALVNRRIRVFGGAQKRPNLNILDMAEAYQMFLEAPAEMLHRETFNVGFENWPVAGLAEEVRTVLGDPGIEIVTEPTDDMRSYHVSSEKVQRVLGFVPRHTIADAVRSIADAYSAGLLPDAMSDPRYYNVRLMKDMMEREGRRLEPLSR